MKTLAGALLCAAFASSAFAAITPGNVISQGLAVPAIGDVNGDGLTDLIHDTTVLLNEGGTFVERNLGLSASDRVIDSLDANGDGLADLLTNDRPVDGPDITPVAKAYRLYLATGRLHYTPFDIPLEKLPYVPHIADADGDGKDDIVLVRAIFDGHRTVETELKVLISRGDGTFAAREPFRIPNDPQFGRTYRLLSGDLDHDGLPDLVIRCVNDLVVLRGIGGGDFARAETRYLPFDRFAGWTTELADIDGDANLDVIMAGFRAVRVFYGDGRGRFHRMETVRLQRYRDINVRERDPEYFYEWSQAPRNFAFGEFVGTGRTEIATGTAEGDVVVLAYERGKVREVSRLATEYALPDLHAGAFREAGHRELYITWNYGYGAGHPAPRLLNVDASPLVADVRRAPGRARAAGKPTSFVTIMNVDIQGDCIATGSRVWTLMREGIFGVDRAHGEKIETAEENGIAFRVTAPWTRQPAQGVFTPTANGGYTATVAVDTPCGWRDVQFNATLR